MSAPNAVQQFEQAIKLARIEILKVNTSQQKPVHLDVGPALTVDRFSTKLRDALRSDMQKFPEVDRAAYDHKDFLELLKAYAKHKACLIEPKEVAKSHIPEFYLELTPNMDQTHTGHEAAYFMTTKDELVSTVSATSWFRKMGYGYKEAADMSRAVTPRYRPRGKRGLSIETVGPDQEVSVFNTYVPPAWMSFEGDLPDRLPVLFEKLVNHVFPLEAEREYYYSWLYHSLFKRSFVYLVLCGEPGVGKNRVKVVNRALHGFSNTVDGKRTTFTERFNSQLEENTLIWFDELRYSIEEENVMKELQNDTISIEKKGVDATRSTQVHASTVISNNKPRDNYIAMDARKFAPLLLNEYRLEASMSSEEINTLTEKVESENSETYDVAFIAQIGRWIKKHGRSKKWPHLEYRGPMFYRLAHTSMSYWQKRAAQSLLTMPEASNGKVVFDKNKGFLWSTLAEQLSRKNPQRAAQPFPDFSTVQHFFNIFIDKVGDKSFKTSLVPGDLMGDFYVKVIKKDAKIFDDDKNSKSVEESHDDLDDL